MTWCARYPLLCSHDMCNAHQMIINNVREVIGGQSIGLEEYSIINISILEGHVSVQFVVDNRFALKRHGKTHYPCHTSRLICGTLLITQVTAATVIARRKLLSPLSVTHLFQALWRAVTPIGMTRLDQLMRIILIEGLSLCLIIRAIGTSNEGTLVKVHTEPVQALEQIINCTFYCPCGVCIFNAQDKLPSCMSCIEPAKKAGTKAANVLKARGTGSKPQTRLARW